MKRIKSILTVLMAAVFALSLVPAGAWAATSDVAVTITYNANTGSGTQANGTATIPANSDHVLFELPKETTFTAPNDKVFLGWGETASGTPVDKLHIAQSSENADGTSFVLEKTVYALWGDDADGNGVADSLETHGTNATNGSITIDNSVDGETYTAYKLFDLFSWTDDDVSPDEHQIGHEAYSYYLDESSPLRTFLKGYEYDTTNHLKAFEFDEANQITVGGKTYTPVKAAPGFLDLATKTVTNDNFQDEDTKDEYQNATDAQYQDFARAVMNQIGTMSSTDQALLKQGTPATGNGGAATIGSLPLGYYLVDSTLGSLCALDTTNKDVTIVEKNELTTVTKTVKEDSKNSEEWGDKNDADFGQTVEYTTTVTIPLRQSNVVFHDAMNSLTLNPGSVSLTFTQGGNTITPVKGTDYFIYDADDDSATLAAFPQGDGNTYTGDTFAVKFASDWTEGLTAPVTVTITYNATLDTEAIVGKQLNTGLTAPLAMGAGNDNVCNVTFGNAQKTESDWTRTYTWDFNVFKYAEPQTSYSGTTPVYAAKATYKDAANNPDSRAAALAGYVRNPDTTDADRDGDHYWVQVTPLANATFQLKQNNTAISLVKLADRNNAAVYRKAVAGDATTTTDIVTPASGLVIVEGIDADSYVLEETAAPEGYNKLKETIAVAIDSSTDTAQGNDNTQQGTVTLAYTDNNDPTYGVLNKTGAELPSTGGIGTTIFYVAGTVLVVGAAVMLVAKRRMGAEA